MVLKCFDLDGHQPARKLSIWKSRANSHESRPQNKKRAAVGGSGKERECSPSPPSLAPFLASPLARGFFRGSQARCSHHRIICVNGKFEFLVLVCMPKCIDNSL